jgi:hypothetical protein
MKRFGYFFVAALALSLGGAGGAMAGDAPSVSYVDAGYFQVILEVQAGNVGTPSGFELQWMKWTDYAALGGWPADANHPSIYRSVFTGDPTLNPDPGATCWRLAPDEAIQIQVGDFFDETGLLANYTDPLHDGTDFVFRAVPLGAEAAVGSSETILAGTPRAPECTQGFWKNHFERWPAACFPMYLGTVPYTAAQILAIYNTPATGNGLISLAHQLATVKLNICNSSDPALIAADIAAADALIGNLVAPPVGGGHIAPGASSHLTDRLDKYNNGYIGGVANCPTKTVAGTWGALKASYR